MNIEEKLDSLTMGQAAIIGVVLALLYYFMYYENGDKYRLQTEAVKEEIQKIELALKKAEKSIADAKRFEKVKAALGEEMDQIMAYIPEDLSRVDVMKMLSEEAKAAGVNISSLDAGKPKKTQWPFIETVPMSVSLQGSYGQLMSFLSFLTAKKNIMHVERLSIAGGRGKTVEGGQKLTFSAGFTAYRYKDASKEKGKGR